MPGPSIDMHTKLDPLQHTQKLLSSIQQMLQLCNVQSQANLYNLAWLTNLCQRRLWIYIPSEHQIPVFLADSSLLLCYPNFGTIIGSLLQSSKVFLRPTPHHLFIPQSADLFAVNCIHVSHMQL